MKKTIVGIFILLVVLCFINQPITADDSKIDNCDNTEYIGSADTILWFTDTYDIIYWDECLQTWIMPV